MATKFIVFIITTLFTWYGYVSSNSECLVCNFNSLHQIISENKSILTELVLHLKNGSYNDVATKYTRKEEGNIHNSSIHNKSQSPRLVVGTYYISNKESNQTCLGVLEHWDRLAKGSRLQINYYKVVVAEDSKRENQENCSIQFGNIDDTFSRKFHLNGKKDERTQEEFILDREYLFDFRISIICDFNSYIIINYLSYIDNEGVAIDCGLNKVVDDRMSSVGNKFTLSNTLISSKSITPSKTLTNESERVATDYYINDAIDGTSMSIWSTKPAVNISLRVKRQKDESSDGSDDDDDDKSAESESEKGSNIFDQSFDDSDDTREAQYELVDNKDLTEKGSKTGKPRKPAKPTKPPKPVKSTKVKKPVKSSKPIKTTKLKQSTKSSKKTSMRVFAESSSPDLTSISSLHSDLQSQGSSEMSLYEPRYVITKEFGLKRWPGAKPHIVYPGTRLPTQFPEKPLHYKKTVNTGRYIFYQKMLRFLNWWAPFCIYLATCCSLYICWGLLLFLCYSLGSKKMSRKMARDECIDCKAVLDCYRTPAAFLDRCSYIGRNLYNDICSRVLRSRRQRCQPRNIQPVGGVCVDKI